jgi:hypothetical protein
MVKLEDLQQLLAELKDEVAHSSVRCQPQSFIKVIDEDEESVTLTAPDAALVLHSPSTVSRFFDELGEPEDCALELHEVQVDNEVLDELERYFVAVDDI